jgi:membrane protease YdiL (CAAX protease family)
LKGDKTSTMPTAAKVKLYLTGIISMMVLLIGLSFLGASFTLKLFGLSQINTTLFLIERLSYWLALVLVWRYAVQIETGPLLLWHQKKYPLFSNLVAGFLIMVALIAGNGLLQAALSMVGHNAKSTAMSHLIDLMRDNILLLLFTAVTAGVVEELIFRGYLQPRLEAIFNNSYAAIIFSSLLFGLMHYRYGTLIQVAGPTYIGMIFAIYYWKYRNITVIIFCHFLWDLMSLLISTKH